MNVAIYDLSDWRRFLIPALLPTGTRVRAAKGDTPEKALSRLGCCDIVVMHIDLTHTDHIPSQRTEFLRRLQRRGVAVVNGALTNVSKRHLHALLKRNGLSSLVAAKTGDPVERVIVKTDLNYGGNAERQLPLSARRARSMPVHGNCIASRDYPVMRRCDVEERWWRDARLVVERYVSNRYRRVYRGHVFGNRAILSRISDHRQMKRVVPSVSTANTFIELGDLGPRVRFAHRRPSAAGVIALLAKVVAAASIDFGAIDIVEDDCGNAFVIDINSTPTWGEPTEDRPLLRFLADGLRSFA